MNEIKDDTSSDCASWELFFFRKSFALREKLMAVDRMVIVELHLIIAAITQLIVNVLLKWWW